MFNLLKGKIKNFTQKIFGKTQEKVEETLQEIPQETPSEIPQEKEIEKESTKEVLQEPQDVIQKKSVEIQEAKTISEVIKEKEIEKEKPTQSLDIKKTISKPSEEKTTNLGQLKSTHSSQTIQETKEVSEEYKDLELKKAEVKKGLVSSIKGLFSSKIKLSEKEISDFLDDFELSLLEADVSIYSANAIITDLKQKLTEFSYSKNNLLEDIKSQIRLSLLSQLNIDCDINSYIHKQKDEPLIILFVGPNGAGKTTTIAKFANYYKKQGKSIILAAGDTFRAGSIHQLEVHANNLGLKLIKQNYGADPAAVAFDAVASAKANKIDVVLIDTAGRQETNINLMREIQKIKKVVNPHLTIYVGEAQAGQAIVEQIREFDSEVGITGVILTKIDTDPKGGVAISILNELKKPIFFIGTGQEYDDLEKFTPQFFIDRII